MSTISSLLLGGSFAGKYDSYTYYFCVYATDIELTLSGGVATVSISKVGLRKLTGGNCAVNASGTPKITATFNGQTRTKIATSDISMTGANPVDRDFDTNWTFQVAQTGSVQNIPLTITYNKASGGWKGTSTAIVNVQIPSTYVAPEITNLVAFRCNSAGMFNASGTYVKLSCDVAGGSNWTYQSGIVKVDDVTESPSVTHSSGHIEWVSADSVVSVYDNAAITVVLSLTDLLGTTRTVSADTYISAESSAINVSHSNGIYNIGFGQRASDTFGAKNKYDFASGTLFVNGVEINGGADFITEEGTNGVWKYRRWNSGTVEAWASTAVTRSASTTVKSNYFYGGTLSGSIPSGIFSARPTVTSMLNDSYDKNLGFHLYASSATALTGRVMATDSFASASVPVNIYAIGV